MLVLIGIDPLAGMAERELEMPMTPFPAQEYDGMLAVVAGGFGELVQVAAALFLGRLSIAFP